MSRLNVVMLGAPGSGKGTQADFICNYLKIPHISTGEILRQQIKDGKTPLAAEIQKIVASGHLVSDDIVLQVVKNRFESDDCEKGYLLDGFPRNLSQAKLMYRELSEDKHVKKVIFLNVDTSALFKRLTGRRICSNCSKVYNIYFDDNVGDLCPSCGGKLMIREDDRPETVENRLKVYEDVTVPLIDYYRVRGILQEIDGNHSVEDVFEEIKEVFSPHG